VILRKLASHHDRRSFDCGVESVNRYLQQSARQQMDRGVALTHVLVETEQSETIVGFHTLLMSTVSCDVVPMKGLPRGRVAPVVLLAQLGVDRRFQGQGHGKTLLFHALRMAKRAAEHVGCLAVVLDAVDEKARRLYETLGLRALIDDANHLWLPMSAVSDLFRDEE
jgi:GNAT superfamily N-acetyltransferase